MNLQERLEKPRGSDRVQTSFLPLISLFSLIKCDLSPRIFLESNYKYWRVRQEGSTGSRELTSPHVVHEFVNNCFDTGERNRLMSTHPQHFALKGICSDSSIDSSETTGLKMSRILFFYLVCLITVLNNK